MTAFLTRTLRPCVIGLGMAFVMTGTALVFVDRVTFRDAKEMDQARMPSVVVRIAPMTRYDFTPPPWLPITLMAAGGLTVLYSLALPRKMMES